jgi:hypothetical protein
MGIENIVRNEFMKCRSGVPGRRVVAGLVVFFASAALATLLVAQSAAAPHPFRYEVANESTISGVVASVLVKPASGMIFGSHLLLTTASGSVDVSLGRFGLQGKNALAVTAGQQVEVTGELKTIKDQKVFLARSVKVGAETYTIRNEHGIEISPQAREPRSEKGSSL